MSRKSKVLRTVIRDCLYVNWAFPLESLPKLPEPLSYEKHLIGGDCFAFGSALLFRHEHLHLAGVPFLRLSYPQFNLRLYVRDHEGVQSVFFQSVLVPSWVVPSARWVANQPAMAAHFRYPHPTSEAASNVEWSWQIEHKDLSLRLAASVAPPLAGAGPSLGTWQQTVDYFRQRSRGYVLTSGGLQPVETSQRPVPLWPLRVSLQDSRLLTSCLHLDDDSSWPEPHSAWLCPEVPYEFELSSDRLQESLRRTTVPVAPDPAMFEGRREAPPSVAA